MMIAFQSHVQVAECPSGWTLSFHPFRQHTDTYLPFHPFRVKIRPTRRRSHCHRQDPTRVTQPTTRHQRRRQYRGGLRPFSMGRSMKQYSRYHPPTRVTMQLPLLAPALLLVPPILPHCLYRVHSQYLLYQYHPTATTPPMRFGWNLVFRPSRNCKNRVRQRHRLNQQHHPVLSVRWCLCRIDPATGRCHRYHRFCAKRRHRYCRPFLLLPDGGIGECGRKTLSK